LLAMRRRCYLRHVNRLKLHEASKPVPPEPPPDVKLLTQIRDLLAAKN
jgi:hypothetical protein